jgi:hypothetical protein
MAPVSNDPLTGSAPTPVTGSTTSFGTSPDVKVVPGDIPGAKPVGAPGTTATSTPAGAAGPVTPPPSPHAYAAGSTVGMAGVAAGAAAAAHGPAAAGANPDPCVPDPNYKPNPAKEAIGRITHDLDELKEYASYYIAAKVDGIKQTVRNIGLYAALGVIGAVVGAAILATAAGLLVVGIAHALGILFGYRFWLGDLVTAVLILGGVGAGAYVMMNKLTGSWRSQTLKKYEQRKQTQRERFRRDVSDRARQAAAAAAAEARGPGGQKGH